MRSKVACPWTILAGNASPQNIDILTAEQVVDAARLKVEK